MNGGKRTSRIRSEFELWLQAMGGTLRQFQQRREMGRLNTAAAERKRRAEEKVAAYRAASRRKTALLLAGLLMIVTVPTWAVVSALTAPSAHNGDAAEGGQPPGYVEVQPASEENGSIELGSESPSPEPEVAGVDLPPTPEPTVEPTPEPEPIDRPEPSVKPVPKPDPTPKATPRPTPGRASAHAEARPAEVPAEGHGLQPGRRQAGPDSEADAGADPGAHADADPGAHA